MVGTAGVGAAGDHNVTIIEWEIDQSKEAEARTHRGVDARTWVNFEISERSLSTLFFVHSTLTLIIDSPCISLNHYSLRISPHLYLTVFSWS